MVFHDSSPPPIPATCAETSAAVAAPIDSRVRAALDWSEAHGLNDLTLALPFEVPTSELSRLLLLPQVVSVIASLPGAAANEGAGERLGEFQRQDYTWRLPARVAPHLVFVGEGSDITARMLRRAFAHGVQGMVFQALGEWRLRPMALMVAAKVKSKAVETLVEPVTVAVTRLLGGGRSLGSLSKSLGLLLWHRGVDLIERIDPVRPFRRLIGPVGGAYPVIGDFVPGRILIACPTLAAGGAERQIVAAALELRRRGYLDLTVLVSNLHHYPGNDFFRDALVEAGIEVREVQRSTWASDTQAWSDGPTDAAARVTLAAKLSRLPAGLGQEVGDLYFAITRLRPGVVHAWLDHSNVCAGLAALTAGVPRVVLSGRNVGPQHFPYIHQPHMRPAYRAMAKRPEAVWLNNSVAGATDYAKWLGLPVARFRVVYNGVDANILIRASDDAIAVFRERHAIPPDAYLVGGMCRLSPEKRPALWVETLQRVVRARDDVYGLMFGDGPLHADLASQIAANGIADRVRIVPPTPASALALSAFDILLLTSQLEGTPNVVLEAQALGTPVVVCGGGGAAEALAHGRTGLFIESADAPRLADAVLGLLADDEQRSRLGAAGPGFVADRFGLARMVDETLDTYRVDAPAPQSVGPTTRQGAGDQSRSPDAATSRIRRFTPWRATIADLWRTLHVHQRLIFEMTRRDLRDRYAGQILGSTWAVGHPLFLMGLYVFLFAYVFPGRTAGFDGAERSLVTYVLAGLLPWLAVSESLTRGTDAIIGEGRLVKQVVFPIAVLPIKIALVALIGQLILLPLLLLVVLIADGAIPNTVLLLPLIILLQFMAMVGCNFVLSALMVYFRDLRELVRVFVTAGLFLAPILYRPEWIDQVFAPFAVVLQLNPISHLIWCYQDALFFGSIAHPVSWLVLTVLSVLVFLWGFRLFRRLQPMFGDLL